MEKNAKYFRVYYKLQELLAKEFIGHYENKGSVGDVREQSTLPLALNNEADKVTQYLLNIHNEVEEPKIFDNWHLVLVTKQEYHFTLNELEESLRPMIDKEVKADNYYIAITNDFNTILGGFTTSSNGYLGGFFSLAKGFGRTLYTKRLQVAKYDLGDGYDVLTLNCFGKFLAEYYIEFGFTITNMWKWQEELAPKNWNYEKFGRPHVYEMEMKI